MSVPSPILDSESDDEDFQEVLQIITDEEAEALEGDAMEGDSLEGDSSESDVHEGSASEPVVEDDPHSEATPGDAPVSNAPEGYDWDGDGWDGDDSYGVEGDESDDSVDSDEEEPEANINADDTAPQSLASKEILKNQPLDDADRIIVESLEKAKKEKKKYMREQDQETVTRTNFLLGYKFGLDDSIWWGPPIGGYTILKFKYAQNRNAENFKTLIIDPINKNEGNLALDLEGHLIKEYLDMLVEAMAENTSVKWIRIEHRGPSQNLLDAMAKILLQTNSLRSLKLLEIDKMDAAGVRINRQAFGEALAANKNLIEFRLKDHEQHFGFYEEDLGIVEALKSNRKIIKLSLDFRCYREHYNEDVKQRFIKLMDVLEQNSAPKILALHFQEVYVGMLDRLSCYIIKTQTLRHLSLQYPCTKPKELVVFLRSVMNALAKNSSITSVELEFPALNARCMSVELLTLFLDLTKQNINLTHINMFSLEFCSFYVTDKELSIQNKIHQQLALNYRNLKNRKFAFMLGVSSHPENQSPLKMLDKSGMLERNLFKLIFDFAGFNEGQDMRLTPEESEPMPESTVLNLSSSHKRKAVEASKLDDKNRNEDREMQIEEGAKDNGQNQNLDQSQDQDQDQDQEREEQSDPDERPGKRARKFR